MNDLDGLDLSVCDPQGFLRSVEEFPSQIEVAIDAASKIDPPSSEGLSSIAVLGMGGSGISGNVLEMVVGPQSTLVTKTLKGYDLPPWVNGSTLVFAASYSGNTEETLATFDQALAVGARVVVVSTGGTITEKAKALGLPVVAIPPGLQPRAALGYLSVPLLVVCERMGLADVSSQIEEALGTAVRRAREYGAGNLEASNPAKQIARGLLGKLPVIYGSEGIAEVAAYRWKCQLNECAKVPAYHHSFPELNHNEVVGWDRLEDLTKESMSLVILRHRKEHERVAKRAQVTIPLIEKHLSSVHEVWAEGESDLARLVDLCYLGDFVATYLAFLQDVDPAPVHVIEDLKRQLADQR